MVAPHKQILQSSHVQVAHGTDARKAVASTHTLSVRLRRLERLAGRDKQVAAGLRSLRRALGIEEASR